MYVSFIGLRLTKKSLTLINRTRLRTKGQSAGYHVTIKIFSFFGWILIGKLKFLHCFSHVVCEVQICISKPGGQHQIHQQEPNSLSMTWNKKPKFAPTFGGGFFFWANLKELTLVTRPIFREEIWARICKLDSASSILPILSVEIE